MKAVRDRCGQDKDGLFLATGFTALLWVGSFFNGALDPARELPNKLDESKI